MKSSKAAAISGPPADFASGAVAALAAGAAFGAVAFIWVLLV
jgi:hypothetical protein